MESTIDYVEKVLTKNLNYNSNTSIVIAFNKLHNRWRHLLLLTQVNSIEFNISYRYKYGYKRCLVNNN
jgi:ribosome-associated toxin RatA of RatAB toxin-antitoxin module